MKKKPFEKPPEPEKKVREKVTYKIKKRRLEGLKRMEGKAQPISADDAAMLAEELPDLKVRTQVKQMYTDGAYNSDDVDRVMRQEEQSPDQESS